ncbi:hypothetical protein YC2023_078102 [Brassica napus]
MASSGVPVPTAADANAVVAYSTFNSLRLHQVFPTVTVNVSLWDEAASTFRGLLKAGDKSLSIMLVTSVNPKLFGGELYLNSTQGTRFFFDTTVPEIAEFVGRVGAEAAQGYTSINISF